MPKKCDRSRCKPKSIASENFAVHSKLLTIKPPILEAFLWEEKWGFGVLLPPLLPHLSFYRRLKMENLDELRAAKAELEGKIQNERARHVEATSKLKERMEIVDKAIFELDEGRTLEAAKRAQAAHPEFAKVLLAMREQIELEEVAKAAAKAKTKGTGKRGRPSKNADNVSPNTVPTAASKSTAKK